MGPNPCTAALAGVLACLAASPAAAEESENWDFQENTFGATNLNAQAGNGGLTAGFARTGELTVLNWPSPSYHDQVNYETSTADDARELPYFGALPNEGVFAGIYHEGRDGEGLAWLRDAPFVTTQRYRDDRSGVVVTEHRADELGLTVTAESLVLPSEDVLALRYVVARDADSTVGRVQLVFYENLAPCLDKDPHTPLQDWMFDGANDFGALYASENGAVLHFRPGEPDLSLLDGWMDTDWSDPAELAAEVADGWGAVVEAAGPGVYLAIGGDEAPEQLQIGLDGEQACQDNTGWSYAPADAFEDAADGELQGSHAAGCQATAAMTWSHDFKAHPTTAGVFRVIVAVDGEAHGALTALDQTRARSWDDLVAEVDGYWDDVLDGVRLPTTDDPELLGFAQRWAISLLQGTDRETSAIVASISTQPPYRQDWPRDSAFFNLALDVAGMHELVTEHNAFLVSVQETEDHEDDFGGITPQGAWHMNFYADGEYGGFIPFEIDATGLITWSLWNHALYLPGESARRAYLHDTIDAIVLAGDLLSGCVDDGYPYGDGTGSAREQLLEDVRAGRFPDNDDERAAALQAGDYQAFLQCPANEDDHYEIEQTLYGAHTTRLGLLAAAEAIRATCGDEDRAAWYETRAGELAVAMEGLFHDGGGDWTGRTDWMLWPYPALALDDPAMTGLAENQLAAAEAALGLEADGARYINKNTLALARAWRGDADRLAALEPLVHGLAVDVPTGTRHVGEVWVALDSDGDGSFDTYDNRTAIPHLWTASLTYLSLMALTDPERLDPVDASFDWTPCHDGVVYVEPPTVSCSCRQEGARDGGSPSSVAAAKAGLGTGLALALALASRRRRR